MSLIPPNVGPVPPADKVEANELAAAYRNTVIEIQSKLFDRAAAYSNLIMLGGYAGAFTIWANTKAQLSPKSERGSSDFVGSIAGGICAVSGSQDARPPLAFSACSPFT